MRPGRLFIYDVIRQTHAKLSLSLSRFSLQMQRLNVYWTSTAAVTKWKCIRCDVLNWKLFLVKTKAKERNCLVLRVKTMENMNGQAILNGQGHLKGNYSHDDRIMKNGGSSGSNSSEY